MASRIESASKNPGKRFLGNASASRGIYISKNNFYSIDHGGGKADGVGGRLRTCALLSWMALVKGFLNNP